MEENLDIPVTADASASSASDDGGLASLFAETSADSEPEQTADPEVVDENDPAKDEAQPEAEAPSIFADDELEPEVKEGEPAELVFDPEAFIGSLDAPDKLTALKPEQLQAVAPQLVQQWQEARAVQGAAASIEEKTGIAMEHVPAVMEMIGPLVHGNAVFDPETGATGIHTFMRNLYEFGADPGDPNANASTLQKGQLYTQVFANMLSTELAALERLQPSADGQLPFFVENTYKPILKQVLGVDVTPETLETLKQVAQHGLPVADDKHSVGQEEVKATLDLVPDKSLHQYWRRLSPAQQFYLTRSTTPESDVIATLEGIRDVASARETKEAMDKREAEVQKAEVARLDSEKTKAAETALDAEIDKIVEQSGKLFADADMEKWRRDMIRYRVDQQLKAPQNQKFREQYIAFKKAGNDIMANSMLTKLTKVAREYRAAEADRWQKLKPSKPKAATRQPLDSQGRAQFKAAPAPGAEDLDGFSLADLANTMFGRG